MKLSKLTIILIFTLLMVYTGSAAIGDQSEPAESCKQISDLRSSASSGVYWIDPDGNGKFEIYCGMDYDGGGWTLLMTLDDDDNEFTYSSSYWENTATLNENDRDPFENGFDTSVDGPRKYESFHRVSGDDLRLEFGNPNENILFQGTVDSDTAYDIFTRGMQLTYGTDDGSGTSCSSDAWGVVDHPYVDENGDSGSPMPLSTSITGSGVNIESSANQRNGKARFGIRSEEDTYDGYSYPAYAIGLDSDSVTWHARENEDTSCLEGTNDATYDTSGALWIRENTTYESADFSAEITGPDEVTEGSAAQYFGTVENTGGTSGNPGIMTIEKDGDDGDESWNVGALDPGETFERSRFVAFGSTGDYQVCTQLTDDAASQCKTVTATSSTGAEGWKDLTNFELDLTGPDSGIGWDENDGAALDIEYRDGRKVVFTDIYWQDTHDGSDTLNVHEPKMCGDDQREYLLEEMGESINSEKFEGRYACANDNDYCVYRGTTGEKIFERADSDDSRPVNTEEPGEEEGRLKRDLEICAQRPGLTSTSMSRDYDPVPQWYDQDYANSIEGSGNINVPYQNICRENSLYGQLGVRWITKDYIQNHPHAVTGGIDDSWNPRMNQMGHPSLDSRPDQDTYSDNVIDNGVTPVDTGTLGSTIADPTNMNYGFCAGDDSSEYLVHQKSETRFLETDNSVLGAAEDPRTCVLENSRLDNADEERRLYEEGERVDFEVGDGSSQRIACFNGAWWGDWPVVFLEDEVTAYLGETRYSSFRVINPEDTSREFDLTLNIGNDQLDQLTTFASSGSNEMNTTVPGQSSRTFDIEIRANREIASSQVELQGESRRGDLEGFDTLEVEIVENGGTAGNTQGQVRDVPGLTLIQLIVLGLISSIIYFRTQS